MEEREGNAQCQQRPARACNMKTKTTPRPMTMTKVAECHPVIQQKVMEKREFCRYGKRDKVDNQTCAQPYQYTVERRETEEVKSGAKSSNTEEAQKPSYCRRIAPHIFVKRARSFFS